MLKRHGFQNKKHKLSNEVFVSYVVRLVLITVRNSSCGEVMFSQASVILSMGGKGHAWQGAGGHAWRGGRRACMAGGMHDRGCVWQGVMGGGGMHGGGHTWHGRGRAWQEKRPLQRTVHILLECIRVETTFAQTLL